jgi:hypothetical protein
MVGLDGLSFLACSLVYSGSAVRVVHHAAEFVSYFRVLGGGGIELLDRSLQVLEQLVF